MENKKNKNLRLSIIAIFISILSIFISILNFNGTNKNNNYLLNGQQTHVAVEPIKHNAFNVTNDFNDLNVEYLEDGIKIIIDYKLSENIYFEIWIVQWWDNNGIDIENYFYIGDTEYLVYVFNSQYSLALEYYNLFNYEFTISQVDNLEFNFNSLYVDLNDFTGSYIFDFDCPTEYYEELLQVTNGEYYRDLYSQFYLDYFFNLDDYNGTFFDNISLIATKVGAILVATLSPITTLLFSNGKLTIVGASLAMALGVGAIYLIFRMVRGLIKQNGRG